MGNNNSSTECCGTCIYTRYNRYSGDFECICEDSEAYGLPTAYDDKCEEWEKRHE